MLAVGWPPKGKAMKPHPEWRPPAARPLPVQPSIQFGMCHCHQLWHPRDAALLQPVSPLVTTFSPPTTPEPLDLLLLDPVTQEITRPSLLAAVDRTTGLILSTFLVANAKSQGLHKAWGGEQSC